MSLPSSKPSLANRVFGLAVSSLEDTGLPQPHLVGAADVVIEEGSVPSFLPSGAWAAACVQRNESDTLFSLPLLGRVWVRRGDRIIVQPHPGKEIADLAPFLRTAGLGAILHQRGAVTLHAAVMSLDGGAVVLAAASGTGKSVLAAALHARGVFLMSDEICCCDPASLEISSGVPEIWVWPDAAKCSAINQVNAPPVRQHLPLQRLGVQFFAAGRRPLRTIYFLEPIDRTGQVHVQPLPPTEAVALFLDTLYQPHLFSPGMRRVVAECALRCATHVPCRILRVPRSLHRLAEVTDCLMKDIAL